MPFRHSIQPINSASSISSGNLENGAQRTKTMSSNASSIVVYEVVSDVIYYKLAKHFQLTQYSDAMNMDGHDAIFIDCRGSEVRYPDADIENLPAITFVLVDEFSYTPDALIDDRSQLELITESELNSATLQLRIDIRKRKIPKPAFSVYPIGNVVEDNALSLLQIVIQNSTDWMAFKDLNHRFLMASERFLKTQDLRAEDIIGKNDLEIGTSPELVLGDDTGNWKGYWHLDDEVIASGKPSYKQQLIIQENALEQIHEHVARVPVRNSSGAIIGLFVCVTQVRSAKYGENKTSELASRRNIEASAIIRSLDDERSKAVAMNKQTESAFKRKNNFIATASHDLRQPLHAIGLFIESLDNQIKDESQRATLAKMKQSSIDLNNLLNSIMDISKLDADAVPVSKTHFSIAPLLRSIEDEFKTEANRKGLQLHIASANSIIHTDSLLLVRILRNLVSNAVKHTKSGNVNVLTEVEADSLLLHVKDSGPGIPKAQYEAIFDEYHQLESEDTQPNFGMGLGLSIVKRLTDLLNLQINLESKLESGTCFTLQIPLGLAANTQTDNRIDSAIDAFEAYKLIVVEDDEVVLEAMQQMLTSMNCDVYPANDIPEALEIIEELDELPDLLIVDYQLANGVTGDTAIEKICETAQESIPAIIVTGNTNSNLFRRASSTQSAYRVLNKPVSPDVLLRTIASAVKEHREVEA